MSASRIPKSWSRRSFPASPARTSRSATTTGRLILEGQREEVRETGPEDGKAAAGSWLRRERVVGRFHRSFDLSEGVDSSAIKAESKDGILTVVLPKLEKAQPRQIEVSVH